MSVRAPSDSGWRGGDLAQKKDNAECMNSEIGMETLGRGILQENLGGGM